jgi:hypothetical protein
MCGLQVLRSRGSALAITAITFALVSTASCSPSPVKTPSLASLRPDQFTLYEGLPHQHFEPELLAEEKKTKPTIEKGGFPFYRDPLTLAETDAAALRTILGNPGSFRTLEAGKACGGFHPDYAVVASPAGEEINYLICFGCGDVTLYGKKQPRAYYELNGEADERLGKILKPYRKNHPNPIKAS